MNVTDVAAFQEEYIVVPMTAIRISGVHGVLGQLGLRARPSAVNNKRAESRLVPARHRRQVPSLAVKITLSSGIINF